MVSEEIWNRLQEKYDIEGYTDSIVYINLDSLIELDSKIEAITKLTDAWNTTGYNSEFALHALKQIIVILSQSPEVKQT